MKININEYIEQKINIKENIISEKILIQDYIIQKINIEDSNKNG
jgi:hypothetical protein